MEALSLRCRWIGRRYHGVVFVNVFEVRLCIPPPVAIDRHQARSRPSSQVVSLVGPGARIRRRVCRHRCRGCLRKGWGHCTERCRWRTGRRDKSAAALLATARVLATCRTRTAPELAVGAVLPAASRLVTVVWVLALVADLLFLGKPLPAVLDLLRLFSPLLTDEFADLRVGEPRMLCCHLGLVVLAVEDECCPANKQVSAKGNQCFQGEAEVDQKRLFEKVGR